MSDEEDRILDRLLDRAHNEDRSASLKLLLAHTRKGCPEEPCSTCDRVTSKLSDWLSALSLIFSLSAFKLEHGSAHTSAVVAYLRKTEPAHGLASGEADFFMDVLRSLLVRAGAERPVPPLAKQPCERCRGRGKTRDCSYDWGEPTWETCETCKGSGKSEKDVVVGERKIPF